MNSRKDAVVYIIAIAIGYGILASLSSCGNDTEHVINGETIPRRIDIVHTIELEDFEARFQNECEEEFDTQEEIDTCVDEKVDELLNIIDGILNPNPNKEK